ncbi:MAG: hypothetical protein JXA81_10965 [Sedimentisphaerales bacterium]|nr:hypothetical protein [Sedimentisphaerales bacterium]
MKRLILKALVIIITTSAMLTVGCGPQSTGLLTDEPPSVKKCRVIAAENIELKKELAKSDKEIEMLKAQYSQKIDEQRERLQKCLQEKEELKEKSRQNVREQVSSVLDTVMEENKNLREENTKLKAQIEQLQKQPQ